ncbi:MAG: fumarylacetoacetate hydrolase family protein [Alphaproteobacteria bacterium]|nr:fumarylacetoacetate hydrolase family protein [Alphaproteobacteria bacterium]
MAGLEISLEPSASLPEDCEQAVLVGRVWRPGNPAGPSIAVLRGGDLRDVSHLAPTMSELLDHDDPVAALWAHEGERLGPVEDVLENSVAERRHPGRPFLLAPVDLQALKACGVTFVKSTLERVIEEHTKGDPAGAAAARAMIDREIGGDLVSVRPGSDEAERLKQALIGRGLWSQYLEVGIGPYAEVFTKAQPMSAVGTGANIGLHPDSGWNNPEPELVLLVSAAGRTVGATLGNDVNLRDFEGRSALLLGRAKDNNASCAIGPFIRLFDEHFGIDDARSLEISLTVEGEDGFHMEGRNSLREISRDPLDLVAQTINRNHQYPDGLALFTGTMFAPVEDRAAPGAGFTHREGDIVTIAAPQLGALVNRVTTSDKAPPWSFGAGALMRNLAARKLI